VIELEPFRSLAFEVVDRDGNPFAGAHVALFWGDFDPLEECMSLPADEHGFVRLPKLESQLWIGDYTGPLRATLAGGVSCEPEVAVLDLDALPERPVRFVAGSLGAMVVQLVDDSGGEIDLPGWAHVELEWEGDPSQSQEAGTYLDQPLVAGSARFAALGTGVRLYVSANVTGHPVGQRESLAPLTAGEERRVELVVGKRFPRVRGTVVDLARWTAGRPGRAQIEAHGEVGLVLCSVEASGHFEGSHSGAWSALTPAAWRVDLAVDNQLRARASVVPSLDPHAEVVDLGPVDFEPLPVLAVVRVRDEKGAPVASAGVEFRGDRGHRLTYCDERGVCELREAIDQLPLRVRAVHTRWPPTPYAEVDEPGTNLDLVLRPGADVQGSLLLARGVGRRDIELVLSIYPEGELEPRTLRTELVAGDRFRFEACEPGLAELTVLYQDQEIVRRTDLVLVSGETLVLAPIELALHPFELSFALASGEPWRGGHLELVAPGGLWSWVEIDSGGRAAFLAPWPSLTLWAAGLGARATRFEGVRDGDRLVLPRAPVVEVVVPLACLPGEPHQLVPRLVLLEPEELEFEPTDDIDEERVPIGPDGRARLRPSLPGRYALLWSVRHLLHDRDVHLELDAHQELVVGDEDLRVVVELDPVAVEHALEFARASLARPGR